MDIWGRLTSRLPPPPRQGSPLHGPWQAIVRLNTKLYRVSGGRLFGRFDNAPVCILHHRGAKTGQARETPLVYLDDSPDVVIVASVGGSSRHPAWYHNVRADPDVEIEIRGERRAVRARVAGAAERDRLWPRLLEVWPAWEEYQARTERRLPVIVLEPR